MSVYQRPNSPFWYIAVTDTSGKRVKRTTATTDRREAEALEGKWKHEIHQQRIWGVQPNRSFEDLMVEFLKARPEGKSIDLEKIHIRHFLRYFSGRNLNEIKGSDVRSYAASRQESGIKPATINRELNTLSTAFNWARRHLEWEVVNPVEGNKLPEPEGRLRWLTKQEQAALIDAARQHHHAPHLVDFIILALNTGCRSGEILGLEWTRVDLDNKQFYLEPHHTKTRKRRAIPLNNAAHEALVSRANFRAAHCPASPWVFAHPDGERMQSVKTSFAFICKKVGIQDFHIHDLRHTIASRLVQSGTALQVVGNVLGHRSIRSTERYAHLAPKQVRDALATLDESTTQ
ncbi:MAG: tyrosine-type recombinase/integrase [Magnetococcus sp. YQC-5]